jgi:UDP-N-acetylmuramyl pentapeptide phosphotransferase/UDP-N-acetylglucosamine-1-phosphate transferase
MSELAAIALCVFVVALCVSIFVSRALNGAAIGLDRDLGVQKFHVRPTSRLGGLAIAMGGASGFFLAERMGLSDAVPPKAAAFSEGFVSLGLAWGLAISAAPVFIGGLVEDLTHRVGARARLTLAMVSASLTFVLLGIGVRHTEIWPIDALLAWPLASYAVTILVVGGFTNGMNIIDGFHGLAAGTAILMLSAFAILGGLAGDTFMLQVCCYSIATIAGFFVLNWPRGKLFLGDAGAYLLGFWVVELGIVLVNRNAEISPMVPVAIGIFPLIETLFSMYRRKVIRLHPMIHPDALHLHTLVFRRLIFNPARDRSGQEKNRANARVAWFFWWPTLAFSAFAILFRTHTAVLLLLMLGYFASYLWLYRRLVRFRAPIWMLRR